LKINGSCEKRLKYAKTRARALLRENARLAQRQKTEVTGA